MSFDRSGGKRKFEDGYDGYENKPRYGSWGYDGNKRDAKDRRRMNWQKQSIQETDFEDVTKPEKPRKYTVSIAVPASILEETVKKAVLRTYIVGQLARSAAIYAVDEIVVYDDKCWRNKDEPLEENENFLEIMRVLLEYQECPQYLRKYFFKCHQNLSQVGVLNVLTAPHHLLANQWCEYREGVVTENQDSNFSHIDVGLSSFIKVKMKIESGLRVTVKLSPETKLLPDTPATVVSPDEPREESGFYWGYTVRVANSLTEVLNGSRFPDGYDLLIGTSDKGVDVKEVELTAFKHALIVFGGVSGLEPALEADDKIKVSEPRELFNFYVNTCPLQQTRTIRTEEAVLISLCALQDKLVAKGEK